MAVARRVRHGAVRVRTGGYLDHGEDVGPAPANQIIVLWGVTNVRGDLPQIGGCTADSGIRESSHTVFAMQFRMPLLQGGRIGFRGGQRPRRAEPFLNKVVGSGGYRIGLRGKSVAYFKVAQRLVRKSVAGSSSSTFTEDIVRKYSSFHGGISIVCELGFVEHQLRFQIGIQLPDAVIDRPESASTAGLRSERQQKAVSLRIGGGYADAVHDLRNVFTFH